MRAAAALVALTLLVVAARSQTICEKYSQALQITDVELMNVTISEVVAAVALCESCPTVGWFNGTYGNTNFLADPSALNTLIVHLMGFFGTAIGCSSNEFNTNYGASGFATNMASAHGNFKKPVNKAAFEFFNEQVINVLASHGVAPADLYTISKTLDGFRAKKTGAPETNVVCQDADCTSSPFAIKVAPTYFNPPYVTMPKNTAAVFSKYDLSPHILTESANSTDECTQAANPAFELDLTGASGAQETDPITHDVDYFDVVNCNATDALTGQIRIRGTNAATTMSLYASLVIALATVFALLL